MTTQGCGLSPGCFEMQGMAGVCKVFSGSCSDFVGALEKS